MLGRVWSAFTDYLTLSLLLDMKTRLLASLVAKKLPIGLFFASVVTGQKLGTPSLEDLLPAFAPSAGMRGAKKSDVIFSVATSAMDQDNSNASEQKQKDYSMDMWLSYKPAMYVNLWRLRTTKNMAYNCEFFYNNGSLTGDDDITEIQRAVYRKTSKELHKVAITG